MDQNLISYGKVTASHVILSEGDTTKIFNKTNELIAIAQKVNNVLKMSSFINKENYNVSRNASCNMTLKEKYHRMLGDVNFKYLDILSKHQLIEGIPNEIENDWLKCGTCIKNKMHNTSFENSRHRAKCVIEIIHFYMNGPHAEGYMGERFFLTFIDDFSKRAKVYTVQAKSEFFDCLIEYVNQVENLTGKRIKKLRCDNAREMLSKNIRQFAREKGILIQPCLPYIHELNGTTDQ